ncbi:MAG: prepilin-type N-terminal cleavage/methylation domain-containing protein [Verrucomicrobiota bacterium]
MPPRSPRPSLSSSGFTLVELLTVTAIVGVLAAIIIPVVGKVKESARNAECLSNLRQVHIRYSAYVADNRGRIPVAYKSGWDWRHILNSTSSASYSPDGFKNEKAVFGCPVKRMEKDITDPTVPTYSLNLRINRLGAGGANEERPLAVFEQPSRTLLFADGYYKANGDWGPTLEPHTPPEFIHNDKTNAVFLDGHVASLTREQVPTSAAVGTEDHLFWYGVRTP